jgi:histidinol-phosphate aminotransferase
MAPSGAPPRTPKNAVDYVRRDIRALEGYVPGEQQSGFIKLNTNESAWPPSPRVHEVLARLASAEAAATETAGDVLRLYPDPTCRQLRQIAAARFGVEADQILAGNGSDDCLTILYRALLVPGDTVACPWPTYGLYETLAGIQGANLVRVDYRRGAAGWELPDALAATGARLTLVASPNNPSATLTPVAALRRLAERLDGILVVDEAYVDFALPADPDASVLPHLGAHPNLVVLRTFSKGYGLAGARLGLLFAAAPLVAELGKVKDSYNVNALTQALGAAALEDRAHHAETVRRTLAERARLEQALRALGWSWPPSGGNFLLCEVGGRAGDVYRALKQRGILVRWWNTPELAGYLRITVGRPEQNDALVAALRDVAA